MNILGEKWESLTKMIEEEPQESCEWIADSLHDIWLKSFPIGMDEKSLGREIIVFCRELSWSKLPTGLMFWPMLGEVMLMASLVPSVSFKLPSNNMDYPDSLQATLHQISNEAFRTLQTAHINLKKIEQLNKHLPDHLIEANFRVIKLNSANIEKLLPLSLKRIEEVASRTLQLSNEIRDRFLQLERLVQELKASFRLPQDWIQKSVVMQKIKSLIFQLQLLDLDQYFSKIVVKATATYKQVEMFRMRLEALQIDDQTHLIPMEKLLNETILAHDHSYITRSLASMFTQISDRFLVNEVPSMFKMLNMKVSTNVTWSDVKPESQRLLGMHSDLSHLITDQFRSEIRFRLQSLAIRKYDLKETLGFLFDNVKS
jgi:hypothetical protein